MRRGQALIVVLLALVVVMTVALSIASRSTTEVSVSTAQEESARALAAAEAGVEAKLGGVTVGSDTNVAVGNGGSTYTVTVADFGAGGDPLPLTQRLDSGESVSVILTGYARDNIDVCWSGSGSLETAFYYESPPPVVVVARGYYSGGGCPVSGYGAYNYRNVTVAGSPPNKKFLKLKLLGDGVSNDQLVIRPVAGGSLPKQGDLITAVGQTGESVRKVKMNKQEDRPDIFEAALFSGASLTK